MRSRGVFPQCSQAFVHRHCQHSSFGCAQFIRVARVRRPQLRSPDRVATPNADAQQRALGLSLGCELQRGSTMAEEAVVYSIAVCRADQPRADPRRIHAGARRHCSVQRLYARHARNGHACHGHVRPLGSSGYRRAFSAARRRGAMSVLGLCRGNGHGACATPAGIRAFCLFNRWFSTGKVAPSWHDRAHEPATRPPRLNLTRPS